MEWEYFTQAQCSTCYDVSMYIDSLAIANLSGVSLYGKKIHVTHSKHSQVQMPQAGSNVRMLVTLDLK